MTIHVVIIFLIIMTAVQSLPKKVEHYSPDQQIPFLWNAVAFTSSCLLIQLEP